MKKKAEIVKIDVLTLDKLFLKTVKKYGDRTALSLIDSNPVSFNEASRKAEEIASSLLARGIGKGCNVAVLGENMPNWVIAYFGIILSGATAVPILPDFNGIEVKNILIHSEAKLIFISDKLTSKVTDFLSVGGTEPTKEEKLNIEAVLMENLEFPPVLSGKNRETAFIENSEDDLASIIYTSGTTGRSKGVMLTHKNIVSNVIASSPIPGLEENEKVISILPLSHALEFTLGMLSPFCLGASIYYLGKPPVPNILLPAMKKIKPGVMVSVPILIEKIYRQRIHKTFTANMLIAKLYGIEFFRKILNFFAGIKLKKLFGGRLYFFGVGGAPLAGDVEAFLKEAKFPYAIGYGMTEASPLITGENASGNRFRSTGRRLKWMDIKIAKPEDDAVYEDKVLFADVPGKIEDNCGIIGEILIKGPSIMKGYYKEDALTAEVFTSDGWLKTGDLGQISEDGFLYIKGRSKNMILGSGGENIYPESIEGVLNSCQYVEDSVVVENKGLLVALVQLNEDFFKKLEGFKEGVSESGKQFQDYLGRQLTEIKKSVNSKLNSFSQIHVIMEQKKPFEKTPTKKIKRYLYQNLLEKFDKQEKLRTGK